MKKTITLILMLFLLGFLFTGCFYSENPPLQIDTTNNKSLSDSGNNSDVYIASYNTPYTSYVSSDAGGGGGDIDAARFRPLFYGMPYPFVDFVGAREFHTWRASRSIEEFHNENIAVSFIRHFNVSREDFEKVNEQWRQVVEEMIQELIDIGVTGPMDGASMEIYPVDLLFTFDNERINEFFRWENWHGRQSVLGIYPETVIAHIAIEIEVPVTGARVMPGRPPIDWDSNYVVHSVDWDSEIAPFGTNVNDGNTVTAIISARTGYTLRGLQSATINGNPAVISNNTGITARISYTFTDGGGVGPGPTSVTVYSPWGWNGQFDGDYQVEQLRARVLPSSANQTVVWSSTNPDLIDVDQAGNVQIVQLCCCMRGGSSIFIRATAVDGTFGSFNVWANDRLMRAVDYCENY